MNGGASDRRDALSMVLLTAVIVAFIALATHFNRNQIDNYTRLADAWLHGRAWILFPGDWIDAVPYHGRAYIVEAPMPALLMLPLVAVFGLQANQTILSAMLAVVAALATYRFARLAGDRRIDAMLVCAFLLFGTDTLYAGTDGNVWLLAHISAFCFTMLVLLELSGGRRLWLVTLYGLAAALSRYPMVIALPVYWWLLRDRMRVRAVAATLAAATPLVAAWSFYNYARWGTFYDPGYTIWYRVMDPRYKNDPNTLSIAHVPQQLDLFFRTAPRLLPSFPWVAPRLFGTALTFTSFGVLVALANRVRDRLVIPLAVLTVLLAVPVMLYYDIGGVQYGVRHALDFEPFLIGLVAISMRRPRPWKRVLLAASVVFGCYLLCVWFFAPSVVS